MRTRSLAIAPIALGMMLLSGCVSWVNVQKLDADDKETKGLRYSLATPYLLMKPKPDGTVTYEWLFLPDSSKRYAVTTRSILSTNTLELTLEHGILTKITGKPDSSALTSTALTQAGTVLEAEEKARQKTEDTDTTAAKAEAEKIKTALATAEAAERTAELELKKAKATLLFLQQNPPADAETLAKAQLAEQLAIINHEAAVAEADRVRALLPVNAAGNAGGNTGDSATAWGPLLFRVVQHDDGKVTLQAVNLQTPFETYGSPPKGDQAGGAAAGVKLTGSWDQATKTLLVKATGKVELVANRLALNRGTDAHPSKPTAAVQPDGVSWKITFNPALGSGKYTLRIPYQVGKGQEQAATIDFDVK